MHVYRRLTKFRPDESVCSLPECQRRRRAEYHCRKIASDPLYAQVVSESRKKWRDAHRDYQQTYRQSHAAAVERNRRMQRGRDAQRRAQFLVKNNLALDLKHCAAEAWLIGPLVRVASPGARLSRASARSFPIGIRQPASAEVHVFL